MIFAEARSFAECNEISSGPFVTFMKLDLARLIDRPRWKMLIDRGAVASISRLFAVQMIRVVAAFRNHTWPIRIRKIEFDTPLHHNKRHIRPIENVVRYQRKQQ